MKTKKRNPLNELKQAIARHNESYERWQHLFTNGGQDPFYSDGGNMELVRNHIIDYKRQIKEYCEELNQELPSEYYKELPPEVDNDYMARADEIRENARKSLEVYKRDKNYLELLRIVGTLNKRQAENISIHNVIGYVTGLEQYIQQDDLVAMRRHEHPERYIDSFRECRERAKALKIELATTEIHQMDIFEMLLV